ncbi:hypothetical protein FOA43_003000 [Brettanomyces nanus]|uniref:Clathrin light chain n=1 Tax=Eeniella nana TaxID=13502 RepID=A0A875S417_EENNA|nr:uncharacterized protein FOA43_003000 [Brettanomyces nanus]QPG75643.1 hypothetical protein FOA43_003000 [Brettanomyces nanus]
MADKFPEINDVSVDGDEQMSGGDFLSREKEVLGDEFATAEDVTAQDASATADKDDEFEEFKTQYPELGAGANGSDNEEDFKDSKDSNGSNGSNGYLNVTTRMAKLNMESSEAVKQWKQQREESISKTDSINEKKVDEIKKEAQKATDEFYENYSNKKEELIESTKKEEEEFLKKRDSFLENGTVWERVVEVLKLSKNSNSIDEAHNRDKSRFKELLMMLKDKEDSPGA